MAGRGKEATYFKGQGLGIASDGKSFSLRMPKKYECVILQLDNRSERLREWIIRGMIEDGLIQD
ncbi:hypothetical protein [Iningainema tapete]|uniref:Uncharacterized protein n=1 Tax=Iningainema tapete BLCC-T55 TaxID=2748662 RepID=A0A8J6XB54_9CYAN|nr:hypothetical protein [Iningainema tapete]MBD2771339.1 hypothetical protein [Iningainema tapete BLCC-T55]